MAAGDIRSFSAKVDPKQSVVFDGVDDAITVDAWATERQSAGDTVGTITAWVNPDVLGATYTILSAGDEDGDEFIDFSIVSGLLHLEVSDAGTTDIDIESDDIVVLPNRWTHVAVVQDGGQPVFYVNGIKVAATNDVELDLTSWFDQMSTLDTGNVGLLEANSTLSQDMNGAIGPVKHWNSALTAAEILNDFEGTPQSLATQALQISHWAWDRDLTDSWVGANDGAVLNNAFLDNDFTSITSFLRSVTTLIADDFSLSVDGGVGHVVVVQAA